MILALFSILRIAGVAAAAGIQPLVVLFSFALAGRYHAVSTPILSPMASTPGLLALTAVLALHVGHRRLGSEVVSDLVRRLQFPLALAAGAASAIALASLSDPSLPAIGGAIVAGGVHTVRQGLRRLAPEFRLLALLEGVLAAIVMGLALVAPWVVPIILLVGAVLSAWLGFSLFRRLVRRFITLYQERTARADSWPWNTTGHSEPSTGEMPPASGSQPFVEAFDGATVDPPWLRTTVPDTALYSRREPGVSANTADSRSYDDSDPPWLRPA